MPRAKREKTKNPRSKLPGTYLAFVKKFPEMGKAHEQVANAAYGAGPMDKKTCELVKMGVCMGAGLESAFRSHVRRAMQHGATEAEIEQAVLLAMNTVGFPRMVMCWNWAQVQFERERAES